MSANNLYEQRLMDEAEKLRGVIRDLLALPVAKKELGYLDKSIGTKTENAAWLRARAAVSE